MLLAVNQEVVMICRPHPFRKLKLVVSLALLATLCALQPVRLAQAQSGTPVEDLTRKATLIFLGTVEKIAATTMLAVKASKATAVVRVDKVIDTPDAPPGLEGKQITVRLLEPGSMKRGSKAVFFTKGWLLGKSMAVIEVGRLGSNSDMRSLAKQINNVRQRMADEAVQTQLITAEAVIVGRVTTVSRADIPRLGSEHDPDWYVALIDVETVIKGELPEHTIKLLFPKSDDVMWHNSPKFKEGQQGIWILHRNQARLASIENQYTALRSLDFLSRKEQGRIERLVKTTK
jgi:hypothetical protein